MLVIVLLVGSVFAVRGVLHAKSGERFEWLVGDSAPELYPVEVVKGDFHFEDGSTLYVPDRCTVSPGWGEARSTHIVGEDLKPVPIRLTLRWFSFVEDCFYEGDFKLPKDLLTESLALELPAQMEGTFTSYSRIVVGMAPEGHVVLWLSGGGHRAEVARFKAERVELPWEVMPFSHTARDAYIEMTLDETLEDEGRAALAAVQEFAEGRYERLHRRYPVGFEFRGAYRGERAWLKMLSGEAGFLDFTEIDGIPTLPSAERALPRWMRYYWWDEAGAKFSVVIELEEQKTLQAVESLGNGDSESPLVFSAQLKGFDLDLVVSRGDSEVPLEASKIQVYSAD